MPPRTGVESDDLVTPAQFAEQVPGLNAGQLSQWIRRSPAIIGRKVERLGRIGTYPRYDWRDLAALEREMRRRREQRNSVAA